MKIPKFGTKNVLFSYFWARTFKKLLSYLKSASFIAIFINTKFLEKKYTEICDQK